MSNKNSKRKALSNDALENVSGGVDTVGYIASNIIVTTESLPIMIKI